MFWMGPSHEDDVEVARGVVVGMGGQDLDAGSRDRRVQAGRDIQEFDVVRFGHQVWVSEFRHAGYQRLAAVADQIDAD